MQGGGRGSPRLAWSMPPGVGVLEISRVGARWRGRFRIFSARHRSRTKVSHAENSGMTMLFFSLEVAPVSEGILSHPQERPATHAASGAAARGVLVFSLVCLVPVVRAYVARACVGRWTGQPRMPPQERQHEGLGGIRGILSHTLERRGGFVAFPAFVRFLACGKGCVIMCFRDFPDCRR